MSRPFDDNGAGVISYRAWLYGGTRDGDPMHAAPSERYEKSAYTEARRFAGPLTFKACFRCVKLADLCLCAGTPVWLEIVETDTHLDWRQEVARLTDNERTAWELRHVGEELETVRIVGVPVGEEVAMNRRGFTVIEGTKRELAGVVCYDFEGREYSVRGLSRGQIAERMKASVWQVDRWLGEAKRKLRGER